MWVCSLEGGYFIKYKETLYNGQFTFIPFENNREFFHFMFDKYTYLFLSKEKGNSKLEFPCR